MGADDTTGGAACENNNHNVIEETKENGVHGEILSILSLTDVQILFFVNLNISTIILYF